MPEFTLDARLARDSVLLVQWPLCSVRLMNDSRYPWLVLVPQQPKCVEVYDLVEADQARLWQEATEAGRRLMHDRGADKLNLATLGNVVPQLHLHVIARCKGDFAWPGPVWGVGEAVPYPDDELALQVDALQAALEPAPEAGDGA